MNTPTASSPTVTPETSSTVKLEKDFTFFCPVCSAEIKRSLYIASVYPTEPLMQWLCNLVTHWRHGHTKWDNQYRYISRYHHYDTEKVQRNNRAKRQLLRKASETFKSHGVTANHLLRMLENDQKTVALIHKFFDEALETKAPKEI